MPGVVPTLDWLQEQRIPAAVVSSSSHDWVDGWIETIGLQSRFVTTVRRGDAPQIKPTHLTRDPNFIAMFQAEAKLAVQLQHGNIAQLYKLCDGVINWIEAVKLQHPNQAEELNLHQWSLDQIRRKAQSDKWNAFVKHAFNG